MIVGIRWLHLVSLLMMVNAIRNTLMDALHKTQENIRRVINSPLTALIKLESMIIMGQDARVSMPAIGTVPVCMALPGDLTFIRPIPADRKT